HMCGNSDVEYHQEVLKKGTFISFDRFGLNIFMPDTIRTNTLIDLLGKGYEKQIMLSHDYIINWLGRDFGSLLPEAALPLVADWNLTNIFKNILPALKEANITDKQINTLMVDNPRRFFAGE
ncbi:MAG: phosphotriesterase-related protein, partial [Deltaproteobacteria bacterium]|nr:phosphotriesterase-related protein [Deltaproteobacteria bacterium]